MTLDLRRIFATDNSVLDIDGYLDMSDVDVASGFPLKKPVHYHGQIRNNASVVSLELFIDFEYSAPCDRCGNLTVQCHGVTVDKSLATSLERQESDTIITVPDMRLEVDELVYTEVILNLPSKHLCSDTCKGLCCKCGKNLNAGDCGCQKDEIDSRFEKLIELLNN